MLPDSENASDAERQQALVVANQRAAVSVARLVWSLGTLKKELAIRADWRTYVRQRPWAWLGGAFLFGFVLGCVRPGRAASTPTSRR